MPSNYTDISSMTINSEKKINQYGFNLHAHPASVEDLPVLFV